MKCIECSESLHFRVSDDFINTHAREVLVEGNIERAIKFLKTITEDENIIADVLFGRKKFVEIGDTQEFKLADDNTTTVFSLKLNSIEVVNHFWKQRKEVEDLAKVYHIEVPMVQGDFYTNPELNFVAQAKKNLDIAKRCQDEIMHPEWFIDYSVGNPMNTFNFVQKIGEPSIRQYIKKYDKSVRVSHVEIIGIWSLVKFFERLTENFELNTRMDFHTYDPKEFVDNFRHKQLDIPQITTTPVRYSNEELGFSGNSTMDRLRQMNPRMAEIAEGTMDRLITGTKTYDIKNPDDIDRDSGFIDKNGNWYSAEPMEHEPFANDYLLEKKMIKKKSNGVLSCKDELVKSYGWIAVTVGAVGIYVVGGRFNRKQRQTIKKWFKKYKHTFHPIGDIDCYDDITDEKDKWFDGGRE